MWLGTRCLSTRKGEPSHISSSTAADVLYSLLTQQRPADDVYSQAATQDPAAAGPGSPPRTVPGFSDSEDSDTEAKQPAQSPAGSSSGTRRPLQQVVDSDSEAEEETEPAQIVKGTLPAALDASTSTLAQPVPADAFAMMAKAQASGAKKSAKSKGKRSAFVNDQAHESDEDERYGGFMTSSKNQEDDKDDGSDLDQNLEELVDDQKVDEEVQHEQDLLAGERYQYANSSYLSIFADVCSGNKSLKTMPSCKSVFRKMRLAHGEAREAPMVSLTTRITLMMSTANQSEGRASRRSERLRAIRWRLSVCQAHKAFFSG